MVTLTVLEFNQEEDGLVNPAAVGSVHRFSGRANVEGGNPRVTIDIPTRAFRPPPSSSIRLRFSARDSGDATEFPCAMTGTVLSSNPTTFTVSCSGLMTEILNPPRELVEAFSAKSDVYVLLGFLD